MTLTPTDLQIPEPRGNSDHLYSPGFDLIGAQAASEASQRRAREAALSRRPDSRHPLRTTQRRRDPFLLAAYLCLGLAALATVALVAVHFGHESAPTPPTVQIDSSAVQQDLRALAVAEAAYRATASSFSTDSATLYGAGYRPIAGPNVTVFAGITTEGGYCAGAGEAGGSRWLVYDSSRGQFRNDSYPTEAAAQIACADGGTMWFDTIG